MNYTLIAVRPQPGEEVAAAVRRLRTVAVGDAPLDPEARERIQRLKQALLEVDGGASVYDGAGGASVLVDFHHLQVNVAEHEGAVTVPDRDGEGAAALGDVDRCLDVLRDVGGFVVFDPQAKRVIDAPGQVAEGFGAAVAEERRKREEAAAAAPPKRKRKLFGRG